MFDSTVVQHRIRFRISSYTLVIDQHNPVSYLHTRNCVPDLVLLLNLALLV